MDKDTQIRLTDPHLEELAAAREETDTKPKIVPVHVFNDVSSTMEKVTSEVSRGNKHSVNPVLLTSPSSTRCMHAQDLKSSCLGRGQALTITPNPSSMQRVP